MGLRMLREQASGLTRDQRNVSSGRLPLRRAVITLTALGSEAHSARFGREERERFVSDRFTREPRPAVRRSARA
jgi:hypothetical protein